VSNYATFIDAQVPDLAYNDYAPGVVGDFNGDDLTDIYWYHQTTNGRAYGPAYGLDKVWLSKRTGPGAAFDILSVSAADTIALPTNHHIAASGDFNGDGNTDFYVVPIGSVASQFVPLSTDYVALSLGDGKFTKVDSPSTGATSFGGYQGAATGDFNGDGLADIYVARMDDYGRLSWNGSTQEDYIFLSVGDGTFRLSQLSGSQGMTGNADSNRLLAAAGELNGDGLTDIYFVYGDGSARIDGSHEAYGYTDTRFMSARPFPDLLTSVTNGLGVNSTIVYKPMTDPSVYTKGTGAVYPVQDVVAPRYVVAEVKADDGIGGQNTQTYTYKGLKQDAEGFGLLGFAEMTVLDNATGIRTVSKYKQDLPSHFVGLLESSETIAPNGVVLERKDVTWQVRFFPTIDDTTTADGTPLCFFYASATTTTKRELTGLVLSIVTETTTYDNYGFPLQIQVTTKDSAGAVVTTKTSVNTYSPVTTSTWLLGRLLTSQVTHAATGQPNIVRNSSFTYNTTNGLLLTETVELGTALSYTKTYAHGTSGEQLSVTETWGDQNDGAILTSSGTPAPRQRATTFTYDAKVRFKLSETNPLGHVARSNFVNASGVQLNVHGLPADSDDVNALKTRWTYDAFGRVLTETRPDSTVTTNIYALCTATTCPPGAKLRIDTAATGQPTSYVFQDKLAREVRKSVVGFDGRYIHVDTVYNNKGQVTSKTEPYFAATLNAATPASAYKTAITYDILGRPLTTLRPDGSQQIVCYQGLIEKSLTEANGTSGNLPQVKIVYHDAAGRQVRVDMRQAASLSCSAALQNIANVNTATFYEYDAAGQLIRSGYGTTFANPSTAAYDIRGNKLTDTDPDKGAWTYAYNALGLLVSQTDAKGQRTQFAYDILGRVVKRTDNAQIVDSTEIATWVYDTGTKGIGKLALAQTPDYQVAATYDTLGRPSVSTETFDRAGASPKTYSFTTTYDGFSRPRLTYYPANAVITQNIYTANGYLAAVKDGAATTEFWRALTVDERGQVTDFILGNGVETLTSFDPAIGRVQSIRSLKGTTTLQDLAYNFDDLGNLMSRTDTRQAANETFQYDNFNRLTAVATTYGTGASPPSGTLSIAYNLYGNITSKSDVGTYGYGALRAGCTVTPGYHALTSVNGGPKAAANYCYDRNGNMLSGDGRTIAWTAFDMPRQIARGTTTVTFDYGPDRDRIRRYDQLASGLTTTTYVGGKAMEEIVSAASTERRYYIGDFAVVSRTTTTSGTTAKTSYLHRDHLGSLDLVTDQSGVLVERMSFDAWGKRRQANYVPQFHISTTVSFSTITTRGYTGHEMLDDIGLVHMNGRVYDPELGRFVSADPNVQDMSDLQSWNRYSYVLNNPLSFTDPSGFFFKSIFKAIGKFFSAIFKAIGAVFKAILNVPLLREIIQIVACGGTGPIGAVVCGLASGAITLLAGGSISDALQSMAFSFASMGTWTVVGQALEGVRATLGAGFILAKSAVHGVVGGALAVAQGGDFWQGFAANAVGAAAGVLSENAFGPAGTGNVGDYAGRVATAAIAGGAASELTGGKFANGALTAAFAQMWNAEKIFTPVPYEGVPPPDGVPGGPNVIAHPHL
jgi:RHS repeat-associated protein